MKKFYRPEWTTGRFNPAASVAIYYNLLAGYSYFFEDCSAQVVGYLLSVPRNGIFALDDLSKSTGIAEDCLIPFLDELLHLGLITESVPTEAGIKNYRHQLSVARCSNTQKPKTVREKLPMDTSTAEMSYTEKAGGITSVMFELTYNCSEQCVHCYNIGATRNDMEISRRADREELKLDDYKRIIDELYAQGLVKVCLSGGDPFSKPFVWDIISYLYEKGIAFDVYTNGQRIVKDAERLAKYYPRVVGISIYSGEAADHDYITRVKGSWEKSMSVVRQLSAMAVPLNLKCCIMRPNVKTYRQVADLARQYGAESQFEVSLNDSIDGDHCVSKYLRLTPELLEIVLRDSNIPLYVGSEAPNYGGQKRPMDQSPCGAAKNSFCITPEGNLIPCCAFHLEFGNLGQHSLVEVLQSESLKKWRELTLQQYDECGQYDYCDYCNLCPGVNYTEHGTPRKAGAGNCYLAKVRYELAYKMMNGYDPLQSKTLEDCLAVLPPYKPVALQREKE